MPDDANSIPDGGSGGGDDDGGAGEQEQQGLTPGGLDRRVWDLGIGLNAGIGNGSGSGSGIQAIRQLRLDPDLRSLEAA